LHLLRSPKAFLLCALAVFASSCTAVRSGTEKTASTVASLAGLGPNADPAQRLALIQTLVMREADRYTAMVAQASDDLYAKVGTREARVSAQQWKLQQATAVFITASGENPLLNMVDMVVISTVSRMVAEDYLVGEKYGAAAEPLVETHRRLETNAWAVADGLLSPEQEEQLRKVLHRWRVQNPREHNIGAARFSELARFMKAEPAERQGKGMGSLFDLVMVNPLSGLEPAVQTVEQTREFAARALYYAERASRLLSWQVELLTYQLALQPETQQVLTDMNRVADSTRTFASTAEKLPALVREEREAAINQLLAGVANERSNILATLTVQEAQLKELLPQVRQTLTAGGDMANAVNGAVKSLDAFVHYVSPPDTNPGPATTNSAPFNVLDYGTAATNVAAMARDLNGLLTSVNQSVPQLTRLSQQAGSDAERVVHHAFWLGLILVATLVVGAFLAALAYRILAVKLRSARGTVSYPPHSL
jgi:hypothetical protein